MKVYLAGPIANCNYDGATTWREHAKYDLAKVGISAFSPMRGKEFLQHVLKDGEKFTSQGDAYKDVSVMSSSRGVMTRDRHDATTCDVILVNFLDATKPSIGTCMEIAWADLSRIPIVAVMEPGNPNEHGMILEAIGYRVTTLDEAIHIVKSILLP